MEKVKPQHTIYPWTVHENWWETKNKSNYSNNSYYIIVGSPHQHNHTGSTEEILLPTFGFNIRESWTATSSFAT